MNLIQFTSEYFDLRINYLELAIIENALTSYVCDKGDNSPLWNETYKLNDFLLNKVSRSIKNEC